MLWGFPSSGFHSRHSPFMQNKKDPSDESEITPDGNKIADDPNSASDQFASDKITPRKRDASAWSKRAQQLQRSQKPLRDKYGNENDTEIGESSGSAGNQEMPPPIRRRLPSPKELKKYLDQYTIGQDKAKKHFSVAIYNHCVRMEDRLDRQEAEYAAMEFQEDSSGVPSE